MADVRDDRQRPARERLLQLVEAFVERHSNCSLDVIGSYDPRDAEQAPNWTWFHEFEDRILWDLGQSFFIARLEERRESEGRPPPSPITYSTDSMREFRRKQHDLLERMRSLPPPSAETAEGR